MVHFTLFYIYFYIHNVLKKKHMANKIKRILFTLVNCMVNCEQEFNIKTYTNLELCEGLFIIAQDDSFFIDGYTDFTGVFLIVKLLYHNLSIKLSKNSLFLFQNEVLHDVH